MDKLGGNLALVLVGIAGIVVAVFNSSGYIAELKKCNCSASSKCIGMWPVTPGSFERGKIMIICVTPTQNLKDCLDN